MLTLILICIVGTASIIYWGCHNIDSSMKYLATHEYEPEEDKHDLDVLNIDDN